MAHGTDASHGVTVAHGTDVSHGVTVARDTLHVKRGGECKGTLRGPVIVKHQNL